MTRFPRPRRFAVLLAAVTGATALGTAPAASVDAASDERVKPVISREVVGSSVLGRRITLVRRAHEGAATRVLVIGSIHGDERAGERVVRRLLKRQNLPVDLDLWVVRTINPDGAAAYRRTNANGVDLNRNFPFDWRTSPRGETWSGPRPMSEPESQVLRRLVKRLDPWLVVSFHQPLFGVGINDEGRKTIRALAAGMALPVREFNCSGVCRGTFSSWVNNRTDGLAVTVEFARSVPAWRITRAAKTIVRVGSAGPPGRAGASPSPAPTASSPTPTSEPPATPEPTPPSTPAAPTETPVPTATST